ncbi:MAG TPA: hypothetical protein VF665_18945 [Longimicrobium sp.]|uniref:hypothetical protein n=1 Tax=Longimicrobium sp. TaxID=2029185 RepID=UPI002ED78C85
MYCSTCGSGVAEGAAHCGSCGAAVSPAYGRGVAAAALRAPEVVALCPRCGFQGQSVAFFSQPGPVALMLLFAVATIFPFMGAGGVVYYMMRHKHRKCARCGENFGRNGEAVAALSAAPRVPAFPQPVAGQVPPRAQTAAPAFPAHAVEPGMNYIPTGILAFFAMMIMMLGIGEGEPAAFFVGVMVGGLAAWTYSAARKKRERRREALVQALQQHVLRLAGERNGLLTVTDVASSLGWSLPRAEKILNSLEDGLRIVSEVTNEGVIVYEFREVRHAELIRATAPPQVSAPRLALETAVTTSRTLHN